MNGLALAGVALGAAALRGKFSAAPTAAELKNLQKKLEREQIKRDEMALLQDVQAGLEQDRMLAFVAEQQAGEQQHQITTSVIRILPWALGGLAILITGALVLKKKKPKRRKR